MWKTENATVRAIKEYRAMDPGTFSVDAMDAGKGERDWTPYEFYTTHYFHNGTRLECRMRLE